MRVDKAPRLEEPEKENRGLKKLQADLNLDNAILKVQVIGPILGADN